MKLPNGHDSIELSQCKPGTAVWYWPSNTPGSPRFRGIIAQEPRMLGDEPVVRLRDMEDAYGEWRRALRTTVPAAALSHVELR